MHNLDSNNDGKISLDEKTPHIISRLGFDQDLWSDLINNFGKHFYNAAGTIESLDEYKKSRRFKTKPKGYSASALYLSN